MNISFNVEIRDKGEVVVFSQSVSISGTNFFLIAPPWITIYSAYVSESLSRVNRDLAV